MRQIGMKAIRVHRPGGPEVLRYEDAPRPEPKAGEVLIQVHAASVMPHVSAVMALCEARKAFELSEEGHTRGKIVLRTQDS